MLREDYFIWRKKYNSTGDIKLNFNGKQIMKDRIQVNTNTHFFNAEELFILTHNPI